MVSTRNAALVYSAFFNIGSVYFGLALGIIGPSLLDLGEIYRVDTTEISRVYTARSIGIFVGSAIAIGVKRFNSGSVLIATLLLMAIFVTLVPIVSELWQVYAAFFVLGAGMALYEACSTVVMTRLWKNPTLQIQIYRLGYGFGTFVTPFVVAPFLSSLDTMGLGKLQHVSASRIHLPYAGIGVLYAILSICMITFSYFVALPLRAEVANNQDVETRDGTGKTDLKTESDTFEVVLALLLCSFTFFAVPVELIFSGMITPFVVGSQLRMDKATGAYIGGVFRSTFFVGRIITVIGYKLPLTMIMLTSLSILFLSSIILSFFVLKSPVVVWLASAGLGLGLSTLFGTSIAWTCQYISLKHWHMALLMLAMSIGASSPAFLAAWIQSDPMLLMYAMVGLSVILWAIFGCMLLLAEGRKKSSSRGKN